MFSGPVGTGKTKALCHEAIKLSIKNVGGTGLLGAPTYPMLRDATMATLAARYRKRYERAVEKWKELARARGIAEERDA